MSPFDPTIDTAFREYAELELRCHQLLLDGKESAPEIAGAEDRMTELWENLDEVQRRSLSGMGSDLNWIRRKGAPPPKGPKEAEEVSAMEQQELLASIGAREWHAMLHYLRLCAPLFPVAILAHLRASAYDLLGFPGYGGVFFEQAADLGSAKTEMGTAALHAFEKTIREDARREALANIEHMDKLYAVRESAVNSLRLGTCIDRQHSVPICQLLILPSFENVISWDVIKLVARQAGAQTRLYRSCWRMDLDSQVLLQDPRSLTPTLETAWVPIDSGKLEPILSQLRSIRVPLTLASAQGGCDGTSFEFAVGNYFCSARVGWWCNMPEEWKELRPIVAELQRLFEYTWKPGPG